MKLYLVRHGQTEYNELSLHQHSNVELSDLGVKQAEILAKRFSKIPIDLIYSSTLKRAKDTTEIINRIINKKIVYLDSLKEKKNPSEIVGKQGDSEDIQKIHQKMNAHSDDIKWHYSDEENFNEFKERVLKLFNILDQTKEQNILAVTHGGPIRIIILYIVLGSSISSEIFQRFKFSFRPDNTGITLCEKNKDGKWIVRTFNDRAHLG